MKHILNAFSITHSAPAVNAGFQIFFLHINKHIKRNKILLNIKLYFVFIFSPEM